MAHPMCSKSCVSVYVHIYMVKLITKLAEITQLFLSAISKYEGKIKLSTNIKVNQQILHLHRHFHKIPIYNLKKEEKDIDTLKQFIYKKKKKIILIHSKRI